MVYVFLTMDISEKYFSSKDKFHLEKAGTSVVKGT